ncbi:DUF2231 domain-containing protein [Paenibacillus ferrarius]|uniref:DUF2231 domain-containing protein n=1 Tax=Paenibacillus ferrarius TaxID=1469647 RepID=UPI003D29494B
MDYIIKNAHFIFTHVPIALLIFSFVFDVLALIFRKNEWHAAGMLCLVVGALGAIASVLTGPNSPNPGVGAHEKFAQITMLLSIVLAVVRVGFLVWKKLELGRNVIYLIMSLAVVVLVSYTGHLGGKMVHRDMQGGPGMGQFRGPGGGSNGQQQFGGQRQGGPGQGQGGAGGQGQGQGGPGGTGGQTQGGQASTAPAK